MVGEQNNENNQNNENDQNFKTYAYKIVLGLFYMYGAVVLIQNDATRQFIEQMFAFFGIPCVLEWFDIPVYIHSIMSLLAVAFFCYKLRMKLVTKALE